MIIHLILFHYMKNVLFKFKQQYFQINQQLCYLFLANKIQDLIGFLVLNLLHQLFMLSPNKIPISKILIVLTLILVKSNSTDYPVYASSCQQESATRLCPQRNNATQYLFNLKKGGTDILSTSDYEPNFFLCQEYTFDCGYVEEISETVSIANGIQLQMNATQIDTILPANATLATNIKHYLNLTAPEAKCGMKVFPLILTAAQSNLFFTNYMNILLTEIKTKYTAQKMAKTLAWSDLNVNIKTAVCEVLKQDKSLLYSTFWDDFKYNNFTQMSDYLKEQFNRTNKLYLLRSAYLIDSVSQRCNKLQSVNFLVDQSGSIGPPNFVRALQFLTQYVNKTYDDPVFMSIHFYDNTFEPYLQYNNTKAQLLAGIAAKIYRRLGTYTGEAINKTVDRIKAAKFDKGLNKILIVITDGLSSDQVLGASNYARSQDITLIAVGIGDRVDQTQLLEIAETPSNVIKVTSYGNLGKLVSIIENFFCKQIINLKINESITGNVVRVPGSPVYFRVQKSALNQMYELRLSYEKDPDLCNQSLFTSQYDPFPDQFAQFTIAQTYRPSITKRVYFITPKAQIQLRIKKDFYKTQSFQNSYLSIGGNNMKFNISLVPCSSSTCISQRVAYQSIGKKKDISPMDDKDYNIYGIIAGSIAGLICLSLMGALALKKFSGDEQLQLPENKLQPQHTEQNIQDQIKSKQTKRSGDKQKQSQNKNKNMSELNQSQFMD